MTPPAIPLPPGLADRFAGLHRSYRRAVHLNRYRDNADVLATVGLYVSIFNLFTSLLRLFGFGGSDE